MKKNINYFNNQERSGFALFLSILLLFTFFIFLQKRMIPNPGNLTIIQNTKNESLSGKFSDLNQNEEVDRKQVPTKEISNIIPVVSTSKKTVYSIQSKNKLGSTSKLNPNTSIMKEPENTFSEVKEDKKWKKSLNFKRKKANPISINSQSEEEWKSLYGIGPKYAARIIKYQKWLGGFHDKSQLKEVYGLNDTIFDGISDQLLASVPYKQININDCEVKELGKHPYIEWKDANLIIKYRKHHGNFSNENDLKKIKGIKVSTIEKIKPYLNFKAPDSIESIP